MAKAKSIDARIKSAEKDKKKYQDQLADIRRQINELGKIKDKKKRADKAKKLNEQLKKAQNQYDKASSKLQSLVSGGSGEVTSSGGTNSKNIITDAQFNESASTGIEAKSEQVLNTNYSSKSYSNKTDDGHTNTSLSDNMSSLAKLIYHSNNMFSERELDIFHSTYRFGYFNTQSVSSGREFLFFTRPDLNIVDSSGQLQPYFNGLSYWKDLVKYRPEIVHSLQLSMNDKYNTDYFNHLLQNQCTSGMDIPGLSSAMVETPVNDYGVGYNYRGSSEASDDNPEFSLEFKDNKWLDVFHFFKAYEYYETLKHHGTVAPSHKYIENRIIHDQFAIYKFIVAEDMETIIYWGKMYGVCPKSLPRDAFSNATFDSGITYTVDFQAAFYEDMIPDILSDFNFLSAGFYYGRTYDVNTYNVALGQADGRAAKAAYVKLVKSNKSPTKFVYKLKWRGDEVT